MERDMWVCHGLLPSTLRDLKILPLNLACQTLRGTFVKVGGQTFDPEVEEKA